MLQVATLVSTLALLTSLYAATPAHATGAMRAQARTVSQQSSDSGIVGQVVIGPVRPLERVGTPNVQPYQTTIAILDASGQLVTTVQSDNNGSFRVSLPPGSYTLRPESPGRYPRASPQSVTVSAHDWTSVRVVYDSGIR